MARRPISRRGVAATGAFCLATGVLIGSPAVASVAAVTAGQVSGVLTGVAATSATDAWAVGVRFNGTADLTLIEHWNGRSWRQVKSPNPGGMSQDQELFGVSALSARNAWAVGLYSDGSLNHALIEHWDGTSWKKVKSPDLGCTPGDMLSSVTAISPANVWAVGFVTNCLTLNATPSAFHWNGKSWREVAPPNPGGVLGGTLRGVDATSAHNVWAVGDFPTGNAQGRKTLIVRWTGSKWKLVPSPSPTGASELNVLSGVAATSGSNAWAVGFSERFSPHSGVSVILRWNGKAWKRVPSPHPGKSNGDALSGVSALSASDAFAVGNYSDPVTDRSRDLAARWNGRSWNLVSSPTPPPPANNSGLNDVAATSARNAWAVGGYQSGGFLKILILRWNGKAWRRQG